VPTDEEILSYDNVPVDVAARYLDWTEHAVRQALREGRGTIGMAIRDEGVTYKLSPGGLVRYKREGVPFFDYKTLQELIHSEVLAAMQEESAEIIKSMQKEIHDLKLALYG